MSEANPERGEDEFVLAGKPYRLRPSHTAIAAIERKTGKAVMELVRLGNAGGLTVEQLGVVGAELIRAGAEAGDTMTRAVTADRIGELIFEEGLGKATAHFTVYLLDVATGGRAASGEAKAAPASPTDAAGAA